MASSDVIVRLRAIGQAAFKGAMQEASSSVLGVGKAADKTSKQVDQSTRAAGKSGPAWRKAAVGIAKWAGGAAALYGAKRGIESAISTTEDLAKSTMAIERATGLDTKTASSWVEITKARGINTKQFQVGLVKLSKTMEAARGGNDKAASSLANLGVNMDQIQKGDVGGAIGRVADAFALMKSPAEKAATAQTLFGKSGQALLPLLQGGSQGIEEQMALVQKYGATISDTKAAKEMIARQREMKYAMDGLKVSVGTALLPVLESLSKVLLSLVQTFQPLLRNSTAVKVTLGLLTAAFIAYKVAVIASTVASMGMVAVWALIPVAIAAIVIGLVILYKRWGWFHNAVNNTWTWIKAHWPLLVGILTGPFGLAAALIIKNFGKIKSAARSIAGAFRGAFDSIKKIADTAIHWIADRFRDLVAMVARVVSAIKGLPGKALGKLRGAVPFATGGVMPRPGGVALVGERGPELLALPGGARVTPLPSPALNMGAPSLGGVQTTANFYLDRRLVGSAVARDTSDRKARR